MWVIYKVKDFIGCFCVKLDFWFIIGIYFNWGRVEWSYNEVCKLVDVVMYICVLWVCLLKKFEYWYLDGNDFVGFFF